MQISQELNLQIELIEGFQVLKRRSRHDIHYYMGYYCFHIVPNLHPNFY